MTYTSSSYFASGERVFVSLTNEIKNVLGNSLTPAYSFGFYVKSDTGYSSLVCSKYQDLVDLHTIEDLKVADMDSDGDFDLIFSSYYGFLSGRRVIIYVNDGAANFQESYYMWLPSIPRDLATGDFNNDGIQDLAVVVSGQIIFLINNGSGQLSNWGSVDINYSGILISCDFDNDGKIDVVGLELDTEPYPDKRKVSFIKNLGDGNFEKSDSYEFTTEYTEALFYADVADLNNDGFMDLVVSRRAPYQIFLLLNNGEGIFSLGTEKYLYASPYSFTLGDFDCDSDIDLAISTDATGYEGLRIYENMGNTVFVYFYSFYLHSAPHQSVTTDFNNDGILDISATYGVGQRIGLNFGNGDLFFHNILQIWLDPLSNPQFMDFADFDNDGDVDIVVINSSVNARKLYFLANGGTTVNLGEVKELDVTNFFLSQNHPNPFNSNTKINYQLPEQSSVTIRVYDILGDEIATLVNEEKQAGAYEIEFNGNGLTSGIYFYQLQVGSFVETKKMILIK
jgi:hypothetical protein